MNRGSIIRKENSKSDLQFYEKKRVIEGERERKRQTARKKRTVASW